MQFRAVDNLAASANGLSFNSFLVRVSSGLGSSRHALTTLSLAALTALTACGGYGGEAMNDMATAQSGAEGSTDSSAEGDSPNAQALAAGDTTWKTIAAENASFSVSGTQTVRYGAGTAWITKTVAGSGQCTNAFFGKDPIPYTTKQCQVASVPAAETWTKIAAENAAFSVSGTQTVRYGAGTAWITKTVAGSGQCTNAFFGKDPIPYTTKQCQVAGAGTPPPTTPPTTAAQICTPPVAAANTASTVATVGNGTPQSCTEAALRAAVTAHSVVTFNCGAAAATIRITSTIVVPPLRNTVIDGGNKITLDGAGGARILSVSNPNYRTNANGLTLQHITLRNAKAPGGGYVAPNAGNASCAYGYATGGGAAIEVRDARLHAIDVEFRDNAAATPGPDIGGGAIYAMGSLDVLVSGSRFIGNSGANGGALGMLQSNLRVYNSVFQNNAAKGVGQNFAGGTAASCPGVGHAGQGGAGGNGGAVAIDGSSDTDVTVCGSTFSGNTANELAGALFRTANVDARKTTLDRSTFDSNTAKQGGALFISNAKPLQVLASTFSANKATLFGAAHFERSQLDIVNTTFAGNETIKGMAGALFMSGSTAGSTIRNTTFANNKANGGAGFFSAAIFGDTNVPITNTVFSNNTSQDPWNPMQCGFNASPGANDLQWPRMRVTGTLADTACVSGIAFADPQLGALADNTGPTRTLAPAATSPLRGAGRNCPTTDQRGKPRSTSSCTVGAVE